MIDISPLIKTFLLSMTPVGELRVAIPIALTFYKMSPILAYLISVAGNILAVFLILVFLGDFSKWLSKHFIFFEKFFNFLFEKTRREHSVNVEKYGLLALLLFVAIPLPITGGWTASLMAFVFNLPFKKAFPVISIGVMIAGAIVLLVSNAGILINDFFGWQVLLGIAFTGIIGYLLYYNHKRKNE